MAAYMTISSRYPSRKELYLSRKKGTKGFLLKESMKFEDSLAANDDPFTYVNDMFAFSKIIDLLDNEYFLPTE